MSILLPVAGRQPRPQLSFFGLSMTDGCHYLRDRQCTDGLRGKVAGDVWCKSMGSERAVRRTKPFMPTKGCALLLKRLVSQS